MKHSWHDLAGGSSASDGSTEVTFDGKCCWCGVMRETKRLFSVANIPEGHGLYYPSQYSTRSVSTVIGTNADEEYPARK